MSVIIAKTNELCSCCIYLPAEDVSSSPDRLTAIEMNDLCHRCLKNAKNIFVRGLDYDSPDERKLSDRVQGNSPYLKSLGLVSLGLV